MEITQQTPDAIKADVLPWKQTYLVPIGDVQLGATGVDLPKLRADVKRGLDLLDAGHEVFFIGLGDYVDVASPSGRQKLSASGLYDSVIELLEEGANKAVNDFLNCVKGTEGRWLGVLQGHHYYKYGDGRTSDTMIASALKAKYLGDAAFVRMTWQRGNTYASIDIFAHHGHGSGQMMAAPVSKLEKMAGNILADLYLINHYARRGAVPMDQIYMDRGGKLMSKTVQLVATGGYMRAYEAGSKKEGRAQGSYVEKAMLRPVTLGGVLISLTPTRKRSDGHDDNHIVINVLV